MLVEKMSTKVIGEIWRGLRRFWAFHLCMEAVFVLFILANHQFVEREVSDKASLGICWGAVAGVLVRIVCEWREWTWRHASVGCVTAAVGTFGCWLWLSVGVASPCHCLWTLIYKGTTISILALCLSVLFRYADDRTLVSRLVFNAFLSGVLTMILTGSLELCLLAFSQLVRPVSDMIYIDVLVAGYVIALCVFLSFLPGRGGEPGASKRVMDVLCCLLLPAALILLGILYVYLGKIVVTWKMPSGALNWFGSIALSGYVFFWLALRGSPRGFFRLFARWGWALLLPVLAAQVVGIVIRYQAYGLSAHRYAGMIALGIGIVALVLASLNRRPHELFLLVAVSGLIFTVTPFNVVDVPIRNQEARLWAALERNGLTRDGSIAIERSKTIPDSEAEIINEAWRYIAYKSSTAWHRPPQFVGELGKRFTEVCNQRQYYDVPLSGVLGLKVEKAENDESDPGTGYGPVYFDLPEGAGVPIGDYTHLRLREGWLFTFRCEAGRCYLTVPDDVGQENKEFEITEHINRALKASGSDGVIGRDLEFALRPEVTVWPLRENLALAVGAISISGEVGKRFSDFHLSRCALLVKEVK